MLNIRRIFSIMLLLLLVTTSTIAQDKKDKRWGSVDLHALKTEVQNSLINDGLIKSTKASFTLSIKENTIVLNETELPRNLELKYHALIAPYKIGEGPYRKIYVGSRGTAVGDFMKKGFYGIVDGSFEDGELDAIAEE